MSHYPELGEAFRAIHANLEELDVRQNHLLECRLAHLEEWADMALQISGGERDTLLQWFDAIRPDRAWIPDADVPPENQEVLQHFHQYLCAPERICLLHTIITRHGAELFLPTENSSSDLPGGESFEISETARDKIAYVQNTFSDTAYLQFSHTLNHPRATYFDRFSDVCEEVYNGICEYGILPILHDRDGKLFRFYTLLEKYDLKIICACDIPWMEREGLTVTRYALIRRGLPPLPPGSRPWQYLELKLPADDTVSLCSLLQIAHICRLTPERVDTRPDVEIPDLLAHHITFRLPDTDILTFLAFLTLDVPRGTILGLYPILPSPT